MKLGLENKKQTMWAAALGGVALVVVAYQFIPIFTSPPAASPSAQPAAPGVTSTRASARTGTGVRISKRPKSESLDPTLRLDLLAASEQTKYEGNGRNIFVSQAEEVTIPQPGAPATTDGGKKKTQEQVAAPIYVPPAPPPPTPIPLKFFGFASQPGESKKIFLQQGDDIFVAAEGEIVNRRYKVVRILPSAVEMQDVVGSGPPQSIPLTQG